jgi:hypothetical protein
LANIPPTVEVVPVVDDMTSMLLVGGVTRAELLQLVQETTKIEVPSLSLCVCVSSMAENSDRVRRRVPIWLRVEAVKKNSGAWPPAWHRMCC